MNMPRGTVTFLLSDIEGSTTLYKQYGAAMHTAVERHDAILQYAVESNHGCVFKKMGDGVYAAFQRPGDALRAAIAAQCELEKSREANKVEEQTDESVGGGEVSAPFSDLPPDRIPALSIRIALHTGTAELRNDDYFGLSLARASRLCAAGHGGQILVSQAAHSLLMDEPISEAHWECLGDFLLRDMDAPEPIFQVWSAGLRDAFPALRALNTVPNNLPLQLTSFIGREQEIAETTTLLRGTRLLTILGTGGGGKTRLAIETAHNLLPRFPEGVWFVDLTPLRDPGLIPQTLADILKIRPESTRTVMQTLLDHLKLRTVLLILDNCEHLVAEAARFVGQLLRGCPNVRILATSRDTLDLSAETQWPLPPLSLPSANTPFDPDALLQSESTRLFVERARARSTRFALTEVNAPYIVSICRRVEAIPLAIELAAALVKMLSVQDIDRKLKARFNLPPGTGEDPRHRTLTTTIDWSYDLLSEPCRRLLRRLSVFAGGWTLEAAEAVCGEAESEIDVFDLLTQLVNKSLVIVEETGEEKRYRLLEMVREYATEKANEQNETEVARERHQTYFLQMAEEAEPHLQGAEQNDWLERLEREHDNLRAALKWTVGTEPRLRLASALWMFWYWRGYYSEGRSWLEGSLAKPGLVSVLIRAKAQHGAGNLAREQGDHTHARELLQSAFEIRQELCDYAGAASSQISLGMVARDVGDFTAAQSYYEAGLALLLQTEELVKIAGAQNNLGMLLAEQKNFAAARPLLEQSVAGFEGAAHSQGAATALSNLANAVQHLEGISAACPVYVRSIRIRNAIGDQIRAAQTVSNLGECAVEHGHYEIAACLLAFAETVLHNVGGETQVDSPKYERNIATVHAYLSNERCAEYWTKGRNYTVEQIISLIETELC